MSAKSSKEFEAVVSKEQIKSLLVGEKPIDCDNCGGKGYHSFASFKCAKCKGMGFINTNK